MSIKDTLVKFATSKNIAEYLDDQKLLRIASDFEEQIRIDEKSRAEWMSVMEKGMKIARQVYEEKNTPWEGAASVKFPLIANAAITFAAREYPQLIRGDKVVEAAVFGNDPNDDKANIARRIGKYMSWQLLVDDENWELDTDKLLHMLAVVGTVFRKQYWSPILSKPCFELCSPDNIILNNNVKNLENARRVTHRFGMYKNDIIERIRLGLFCDVDLNVLESGFRDNYESSPQNMTDTLDNDAPHEILEIHGYLDLDDDGYAEPYIITLHRKASKILRIAPRFQVYNILFDEDNKKVQRIIPDNYFTDWHFIPSPDGSFYSMGYGVLLYPLNETINTSFNQLLDAGTLSNMQAGFIGSDCRIEGGTFKLSPGKWLKIGGAGGRDIKNNIIPLPVREPSSVMYQLLGLLIDVGKDMASISEILQGQMPTQNSPATSVLALIKQGLTQYTAIHKRVLNSFKKEFKKLYLLNAQYLDIQKYLNMIQDPKASPDDFNVQQLDIRPVADPNMSTDAMRIARAQAAMQIPGLNPQAVQLMYLEALDIPEGEIKALMQPQGPAPDVVKMQADAAEKQAIAQDIKMKQIQSAFEMQLKAEQQAHQQKMDEIVKLAQAKLYDAQALQAVASINSAEADRMVEIEKHKWDLWSKIVTSAESVNPQDATKPLEGFLDGNSGQDNAPASSGLAQSPSDATPVQADDGSQDGAQPDPNQGNDAASSGAS
jgi:chaperonin GroES